MIALCSRFADSAYSLAWSLGMKSDADDVACVIESVDATASDQCTPNTDDFGSREAGEALVGRTTVDQPVQGRITLLSTERQSAPEKLRIMTMCRGAEPLSLMTALPWIVMLVLCLSGFLVLLAEKPNLIGLSMEGKGDGDHANTSQKQETSSGGDGGDYTSLVRLLSIFFLDMLY